MKMKIEKRKGFRVTLFSPIIEEEVNEFLRSEAVL